MSAEDFRVWVDRLVAQGRMLDFERDRLLQGREKYDINRREVEAEFPGRVVGFNHQRQFVADSADELLDLAGRAGQPVYFEYVPGVGAGGPTESETRAGVVH